MTPLAIHDPEWDSIFGTEAPGAEEHWSPAAEDEPIPPGTKRDGGGFRRVGVSP